MKQVFIGLVWCLIIKISSSQAQNHQNLKQELDSIYVLDQKYRAIINRMSKDPLFYDSLATQYKVPRNELTSYLWAKQTAIDERNLERIETIIHQQGYPGKTLVGEPTNKAAWSVIQHSFKIETYFPFILEAGEKHELPYPLVAMMQDRLLTQQRKPQLYGTQVLCYPLRLQPNGYECFVWAIEDPAHVNERRAKVGFKKTVEEDA